MILHDITSGESTVLPIDKAMDYSARTENSREATCISIQHKSFGLLLRVNSGLVRVNDRPVQEMALLAPGDLLLLGSRQLLLVNDDNVPVQYPSACAPKSTFCPGEPVTSEHKEYVADKIIGLRWLTDAFSGHFQAVESDAAVVCDGVLVQRVGHGLVLYPDKVKQVSLQDSPVRVNGYAVFKTNSAPITLRHGDVVQSGQWRFRAEIPVTAGTSVFSPSHPRNIQLSEEYLPEEVDSSNRATQGNRQWLWAMVMGLMLALAVTLWLKQHV